MGHAGRATRNLFFSYLSLPRLTAPAMIFGSWSSSMDFILARCTSLASSHDGPDSLCGNDVPPPHWRKGERLVGYLSLTPKQREERIGKLAINATRLDALHKNSREAAMAARSVPFRRVWRGTEPIHVLASVYGDDHARVQKGLAVQDLVMPRYTR